MALTTDRDVQFYATQELLDLPVLDDVVIYKGALIGVTTAGFARPLQAGDIFGGVAYRQADNTGAGHASGAIKVRAHQMVDIVHTLTGVTEADIGSTVYASADDTLTLTQGLNSTIGVVVGVEGANVARVRCTPWA